MNLIEANLVAVPVAVIAFMAIAVFTDLKSRQIPNWLTVSSLVIALLFHFFSGGLDGLLLSIGGFATGFGILFVLWIIGGGGGGDVKLMGALGAWVGPMPTLLIFLGSTFCALLCMVALVVFQSLSKKVLEADEPGANPPKNKLMKQSLPFAVPASLATVVVVLMQFVKAAN
ncbi:MAG: prepilin peptidase [Mariniblastus sp.]